MTLRLVGGAATFALVLAFVGTFATVASREADRRSEAALRLALGATAMVLARDAALRMGPTIVVGTAVGLLAAASMSRVFASLLVEVKPIDITTYASVAVSLIAAGTVASASAMVDILRVDLLPLLNRVD